jgi:hypothetical protein
MMAIPVSGLSNFLRSPDCLVGLPPERYGATVARLRRIFLRFLGWFLIDMKYGATVAHLRRIFFDACWISFLIHIS